MPKRQCPNIRLHAIPRGRSQPRTPAFDMRSHIFQVGNFQVRLSLWPMILCGLERILQRLWICLLSALEAQFGAFRRISAHLAECAILDVTCTRRQFNATAMWCRSYIRIETTWEPVPSSKQAALLVALWHTSRYYTCVEIQSPCPLCVHVTLLRWSAMIYIFADCDGYFCYLWPWCTFDI